LVVHDQNGSVSKELFDLNIDPGELIDLSKENPEIIEELEVKLLQWQESVLNSLTGADY
jgi:hypothetical protein